VEAIKEGDVEVIKEGDVGDQIFGGTATTQSHQGR